MSRSVTYDMICKEKNTCQLNSRKHQRGSLVARSATAPTLRSHLHDLQDLPRSANERFTGRRPVSSQPRCRWRARQPSARSVVRNAGPKAAFVPCALRAVESAGPVAPVSASHHAGASLRQPCRRRWRYESLQHQRLGVLLARTHVSSVECCAQSCILPPCSVRSPK